MLEFLFDQATQKAIHSQMLQYHLSWYRSGKSRCGRSKAAARRSRTWWIYTQRHKSLRM